MHGIVDMRYAKIFGTDVEAFRDGDVCLSRDDWEVSMWFTVSALKSIVEWLEAESDDKSSD